MQEPGTQDDLQKLAARLTTVHGAGMFPAMAQYLAAMLRAEEVLIGEAADEFHARTLGVSINGAAQPNYQFPVAGTPCEALIGSAHSPGNGASNGNGNGGEPHEETESSADDSGYFGMALHDGEGAVIGFVCARSAGPLVIPDHQHCLIEIVAVLLTTELQLLRAERARGELDQQVHRLRAELDARERGEVMAAATGQHRVLTEPASIDLDSENTGLHHVQREHILRVLNATRWVIEGNSGAALKLGMKPATLRHRMKKLGIARARPAPG